MLRSFSLGRFCEPLRRPHENFHPRYLARLPAAFAVDSFAARDDDVHIRVNLTREAFGGSSRSTAGDIEGPIALLLNQCEAKFWLAGRVIPQCGIFGNAIDHNHVDRHVLTSDASQCATMR
jgi:hypothetical protein